MACGRSMLLSLAETASSRVPRAQAAVKLGLPVAPWDHDLDIRVYRPRPINRNHTMRSWTLDLARKLRRRLPKDTRLHIVDGRSLKLSLALPMPPGSRYCTHNWGETCAQNNYLGMDDWTQCLARMQSEQAQELSKHKQSRRGSYQNRRRKGFCITVSEKSSPRLQVDLIQYSFPSDHVQFPLTMRIATQVRASAFHGPGLSFPSRLELPLAESFHNTLDVYYQKLFLQHPWECAWAP